MPKPESFIASTDYATLKNDAKGIVSVTAPGSIVIPGSVGSVGSYVAYQADLVIGATAAITRIQISSSKNGNNIQVTRNASGIRTGVSLGFSTIYSTTAFVYRISPTTVRCQVYTPNPQADPLTTEAGNETFTFYVNTFLPPFA